MSRAAAPVEIAPALLSLPDAARYLGIALGTLRGWVYEERSIPSVRLGKGKHGPRRIRRADLDALIEKRTLPAVRVEPGRVVPLRPATRGTGRGAR